MISWCPLPIRVGAPYDNLRSAPKDMVFDQGNTISIKFLSVWTVRIKHANNDMTDRLIIICFQCVMFDQSQGNAPCPSFCLLPEQRTHCIASHGSVWLLLCLRINSNLYVENLLSCTFVKYIGHLWVLYWWI